MSRRKRAAEADFIINYFASGAPPGTSSAMLFPLSKMESSFVTRFPSGVNSLHTQKENNGA